MDQALLARAQSLLSAQRWAEARPLLEALHRERPAERVLLLALCEAEILGGDPARARERLVQGDLAGDAEMAFLHARAQAALGHDVQALAELRALRARLPGPSAPLEMHLAALAQRQGDLAGARESLQRATTAEPGSAAARVALARIHAALGETAQRKAELAIAARLPADPALRCEAARLHGQAFEWSEASAAFAQAAAQGLLPPWAEPLAAIVDENLGEIARARGRLEALRARDPLRLDAAIGARLMLPHVYRDAADLARWRDSYAQGLAALEAEAPALAANAADAFRLDRTNFLLAYQGRDDRVLQHRYATFLSGLLHRGWPHDVPQPARGRRVRVGFASAFLHDCTIARYFGRWMTGLDPSRFERRLYHLGSYADGTTAALAAACDAFIPLRAGALDAARRLRAEALDILVYPEVGMDPTAEILAMLRLAPVQLAGWGHPVTTGSEAIDGFLTLHGAEPDDGETHYTERLLRLPFPGVSYALPVVTPMARSTFGLPEDARLYACPQSLFKIHPDMDAVFASIALADPSARFVFLRSEGEATNRDFAARFARALEAAGAVTTAPAIFLPRLRGDAFRALLGACDVVVDTLHWSGGNTTFDALAAGAVVVTTRGRFMRGRQTAAMLDAIGLPQLVAESPEALSRLAVALATDRAANAAIRRHVEMHRSALFERAEPIAALGEILVGAVEAGPGGLYWR